MQNVVKQLAAEEEEWLDVRKENIKHFFWGRGTSVNKAKFLLTIVWVPLGFLFHDYYKGTCFRINQ